MLKFTGYINDRPSVGLGLSDDNIKLLQEGRPMLIHLSEVGLPYDLQLFIFYGPTEQDMINSLKDIGAQVDDVPIHESREPH
jgi:hypothetical protein